MIMRSLTRYVLIELLIVFLMTLTGMTLLMLLVGLATEAYRQGLGAGPLLQIIPYLLPNALRFTVPGTILFAVCSVYGRMSYANEILVIKSLGLSPMTVLAPALVLSFVVSLAAVWLNDVAVSWGKQGVRTVIMHSIEEIIYGMLRTQRTYTSDQLTITVKDVQDRNLIQPTIAYYPAGGEKDVTIVADSAELQFDPTRNVMKLTMANSEGHFGDGTTFSDPGVETFEIPLTNLSRNGSSRGRISDCALGDIPHRIKKQYQSLADLQQTLAVDASVRMMTGDFSALKPLRWKNQYNQLNHHSKDIRKLEVEPYRRWANGFSCFCFVLVGAPLAVRLRNSDLMTTFGACFLPILVIYYPLLALSLDRAKGGGLPPYSVWLGNLVLAAIGFQILRSVMRN